jgi:hypothetical protein
MMLNRMMTLAGDCVVQEDVLWCGVEIKGRKVAELT